MAKVKLPLLSQAVSGKVIGVIHQAWRGMTVVRRFTMPTIRHAATQVTRRANFGSLSVLWKTVLTVAQRITWQNLNLGIKDLWGENVNTTGLNLYQRINGILKDAGKTLLTSAPITAAMPSPIPTVTIDASAETIVIPKPSAGDVATYAPFIDIWLAGVSVAGVTALDATEIKTTGVAASINPAKNVFRHVQFIDENSAANQTITFKDLAGAFHVAGIKLSIFVIRYTKDGMKSVPVRIEAITETHV